ncbi:leucine-rich repeat and immunoglobulin-like domain-containing nogo receptor-interacting protein 1 [Physella acuta]|uniref:leucine-rich repeat and immunoglobulin-like domain-containing nogo receptor-interacting protein 1 n=1 Tax=Physella acuta TaxID=109671 RepID=UPI0027DAF586|nr:leucine-rich repeat and immunoglobulin-like domain-containing nogo receptor-interacting protein 1 [Physella acuta]
MKATAIVALLVMSLVCVSGKDTFTCPKNCKCSKVLVDCKLKKYHAKDFASVPETAILHIESSSQVLFPDDSLPRVRQLEINAPGSEIEGYAWNKAADQLELLELEGVRLRDAHTSFKLLRALRKVKITAAALNGLNLKKFKIHFDEKNPLAKLAIIGSDLSKLTSITVPNYIEKLTLDSCNLTEIPTQLSNLSNLEYLSLKYNHIKKMINLPKKSTIINLNWNRISSIRNVPNGTLKLSLSKNNITRIKNIPASVIILDLSKNNITKIRKTSFQPNSELMKFILTSNKHQNMTISKRAFKNTPKLLLIDLRGTVFEAPPEAFTSLLHLTDLVVDPRYSDLCHSVNKKIGVNICTLEE